MNAERIQAPPVQPPAYYKLLLTEDEAQAFMLECLSYDASVGFGRSSIIQRIYNLLQHIVHNDENQ